MRIIVFIACVIIIIIGIAEMPQAGERMRIYDTSKGSTKYNGYAEMKNGVWRFYDKDGRSIGRMDNKRVYNKDGKVTDKIYMKRVK